MEKFLLNTDENKDNFMGTIEEFFTAIKNKEIYPIEYSITPDVLMSGGTFIIKYVYTKLS